MQKLARAWAIWRAGGLPALSKRVVQRTLHELEGGIASRHRVQTVAGIVHPVFNLYSRVRCGRGVDVMAEDWDILILLDACRFDDFDRVNTLDGKLESRFSRGADSVQFLHRNFSGRTLHDTVYITANPHAVKLSENVFHTLVDDPLEEWDADKQCVPPEAVTTAARRANDAYPQKRLIIHYMQPHDPPLGPTAARIRREFPLAGPTRENQQNRVRIMEAVASGDIPVERARRAYRETLEIVLEEVRHLQPTLEGKLVISADHGELFGERYPLLGQLYEHFEHPRTPALCTVPWFIIESETRRPVRAEPPKKTSVADQEKVQKQLDALGYIDA